MPAVVALKGWRLFLFFDGKGWRLGEETDEARLRCSATRCARTRIFFIFNLLFKFYFKNNPPAQIFADLILFVVPV